MRRPPPDISVLIASRGRSEELCDCIHLLRKNYSRKNGLEILVRLDEDDPDEFSRIAMEPAHCADGDWPGMADKVYVGPSVGWRNVHLLYNDLASKARGRWLFPLADDAKVETPGWDRRLRPVRDKISIVKFEDGWRPGPNFPTFPLITRTVYEGLGHLAMSPHIGLWLDEVVRQRAGFALKYFPDVVIHHVKPRAGADMDEVNDSYADFYSMEGEQSRSDDARRLLDFYGRQAQTKPRSASLEQKLDSISRRWFLSALHR